MKLFERNEVLAPSSGRQLKQKSFAQDSSSPAAGCYVTLRQQTRTVQYFMHGQINKAIIYGTVSIIGINFRFETQKETANENAYNDTTQAPRHLYNV